MPIAEWLALQGASNCLQQLLDEVIENLGKTFVNL